VISGAHVLLYSTNPDADRAFFRDVLGWRHVDAGGGWLIFAMPPAEVAIHPVDAPASPGGPPRMLGGDLYLMCDDLAAEMRRLASMNVACTEVHQERWGLRTTVRLPSGGAIGLYQPMHVTAIETARPLT
jgi:catechol 2,3-dioxygenase-like lactoylglutathione lyase family enzyme